MNCGRFFSLLAGIALFTTSSLTLAAEVPLPSDLQSMKGELLNLNREITQLENDLLFPSSETAIVVALEAGAGVKISDVSVYIDDRSVGYHFYSEAEQNALSKGGMQRIYGGNLTSGQHVLKAIMTGTDPNGQEYQRTATYTFNKGAAHKVIEVKAADNASRTQGEIRFREWETQ